MIFERLKLSSIILVWPIMKLPISHIAGTSTYTTTTLLHTLDCCVEKFFVSQILHIYTLSISQFSFLLFFSFLLLCKSKIKMVWARPQNVNHSAYFRFGPSSLSFFLSLFISLTQYLYKYYGHWIGHTTSITVRLIFAF